MAPRKKATSTGGKKPSHPNREALQQQPAKPSIQHFFERHSQRQKTFSHNTSKRNEERPISDPAPATNKNPQVAPKPVINRNDMDPAELRVENLGAISDKIQSMGKCLRGENPTNNSAISTSAGEGVSSQNSESRKNSSVTVLDFQKTKKGGNQEEAEDPNPS